MRVSLAYIVPHELKGTKPYNLQKNQKYINNTYLRIVFCIPSMESNLFQVQFTSKIYSLHNISREKINSPLKMLSL